MNLCALRCVGRMYVTSPVFLIVKNIFYFKIYMKIIFLFFLSIKKSLKNTKKNINLIFFKTNIVFKLLKNKSCRTSTKVRKLRFDSSLVMIWFIYSYYLLDLLIIKLNLTNSMTSLSNYSCFFFLISTITWVFFSNVRKKLFQLTRH